MKKPIPFGKYLLLDRVNVGGMAEVFKGKAFGVEGFERLVAVKRILPSIAEDIEFITMFIDEAKIAVQLTHANIAQIFDLGKVNDSYFIALEYVQGKDLRAIFERARKRGEPLPVPLACYVIMKVCEGLDYAHNKKDSSGREFHLVHRDVSPQNILLSYDGEVKIIDFGIAKAAGKAGKTQAGILKGKFGYMSPEQVRGLPLDRRSDIFAVGICMYELLTGERLFVGESDFSTLEKVRNVEIMPPSTYNRRIPEELEQIVLKSLSRDFDDRYQTAMDLHDDLQSFMYTSGNFFARKDLATYMKKTFAEEIAKESQRDEELAKITAAGSGLDAFNDIPSSHSGELVQPRATMKPPRKSEQPGGGSNPGVPRVSKVPAPPAPPARMSQAPVAASSQSATVDMEWDDEELSTQIYDRPDAAVTAAAAVAAGMTAPTSMDQSPTAIKSTPAINSSSRTSSPPPLPRSSNPPATAPGFASPPPNVTSGAPIAARLTPVAPKSRKKSQAPLIYAAAGVLAVLAAILVWLAVWGGKEPGKITLTTVPADVTVLFDAAPVLSTSSPFVIADVTPDEHHLIEVQKRGYDPWSQMITLRAGEDQAIGPVTLMPLQGQGGRTSAPAGQSGFTLDTQPSGALVTVDGRQLPQRTPVRVTDLPPGLHQIRVSAGSQYDSTQLQVETAAGQVVALPVAVLPLRSVLVEFQSAPSGATVSIIRGNERRILGATPTRAEVDITGGAWSIEMVKDGFALATQPLTLPEGQPTYRITIPLSAAVGGAVAPQPRPQQNSRPQHNTRPQQNTRPANPPANPTTNPPANPPAGNTGTGTLRINTRPWSQVFVDGQLVGNTPQHNIQLRAGTHRITLVNAEFNIREVVSIDIVAGQTVTRALTLTPPSSP